MKFKKTMNLFGIIKNFQINFLGKKNKVSIFIGKAFVCAGKEDPEGFKKNILLARKTAGKIKNIIKKNTLLEKIRRGEQIGQEILNLLPKKERIIIIAEMEKRKEKKRKEKKERKKERALAEADAGNFIQARKIAEVILDRTEKGRIIGLIDQKEIRMNNSMISIPDLAQIN